MTHLITTIIAMTLSVGAIAQSFQPVAFYMDYAAIAEPQEPQPTISSDLRIDLSTDRAAYAPGSTVTFTASACEPGTRVRYRHGNAVVAEHGQSAITWKWTAPEPDFRGYLVDLYKPMPDGGELILGTIAVDVSSDWSRFPRYGFFATFDPSKNAPGIIEAEVEYLNRCHINGVQFQDWHWKHHHPLGGKPGALLTTYRDVANREISLSAIQKYIDCCHQRGMKTMFYNLCYGALDDYAADGVDEHWLIFKDRNHTEKDCHYLPSDWKSNIFITDPGNTQWQNYIADRTDEVYAALGFDGYQIDQIGPRGQVYDYYGNSVDLPSRYTSFIAKMKSRQPEKRLVMNSIGSFGYPQILASRKVDFAYTECWADEARYSDLRRIIQGNEQYGGSDIETVFAAYINYDLAGRTSGYINTPGALLTDAVISALGAQHLELGDHMLSREYFPSATLAMTEELRTAIVRYYDFITAYQNLLRDGSTADEYNPQATSTSVAICNWPPQQGKITTYARRTGGRTVCHLLNFIDADSDSWRDLDGTMPEPATLHNITISIRVPDNTQKIWVATPDEHGGVPQPIPFTIESGRATVTVPTLKYWTTLIAE